MGVSTFLLDGLTGRGLTSVSANQGLLGRLNFIVDAYRALDILSKHPRVDSSRSIRLGFSRGGQATLYASMTRFSTIVECLGYAVRSACHLSRTDVPKRGRDSTGHLDALPFESSELGFMARECVGRGPGLLRAGRLRVQQLIDAGGIRVIGFLGYCVRRGCSASFRCQGPISLNLRHAALNRHGGIDRKLFGSVD
jgi:hypothetical protein